MVTGAASGIGRAVACSLLEAGTSVLGVDRDERGLLTLEEALREGGASGGEPRGRLETLGVDLLESGSAEAVLQRSVESFGPVGLLVNSAGVFPTSPALEVTEEQWDLVLDTNLKSPFLLSQAAARKMVEAEIPGTIINISSSAASITRPGIAHYSASKAGLGMLTQTLAIEWAEHGIRVNAIAPGLVETPGVETLLATEAGRAEHGEKISRVPMARPARLSEVVEAVLFLAQSAGFVTGETIYVDGGYSAGRNFRGTR